MNRPLIPYALARPPGLAWRLLARLAQRFSPAMWPTPDAEDSPLGNPRLGQVIRIPKIDVPEPDKKTIIVIGAARGGTSMLAGVTAKLGVDMGEWGAPFYEHSDLRPLLHERFIDKRKVFAAIEKNNLAHDVWGWKYPLSHRYFSWILPGVRNPYIIAVFRDPLAVACREQVATGQRLEYAFLVAMREYRYMLDILGRLDVPVMLCSYEKALSKREDFVRSVIGFLDIRPDEQQAAAAISHIRPTPRDYDAGSRQALRKDE